MANVTVHMSGDYSRMEAANAKFLADQQRLLDKYAKLAGVSKQLSADEMRALAVKKRTVEQEKEYQKLLEKGAKITKEMLSPQEIFNQSVKEAVQLKDKGAISADTLARKYKLLKQELREATGETRKLKDAESEENRIKISAEAATQKYKTTLEKLKSELKAVKDLHDKGAVSIDTVERAQEALNKELRKTSKESLFENWGTQLVGIAAGYMSVNSAVQAVTQSMQDQMDLQEKSLDENTKLAMAQSEAVKNFAGMPEADVKSTLELAKTMADELHFKSPAALTEALGATYSVVGDVKKDQSAVRAAAEITRLDPSKTTDTSVGILKVGEAAKVEDFKEASGFLLSVGKESAIKDSTKITQAVTPVAQTAVALYPGQDRERVISEAAAVWATLVDKSGDERGDASATNAITLLSKLNEFFSNLHDPANPDNAKRDKEITRLEKSAVVTEKESQGIKNAQALVEKATKAFEKSAPGGKDFEKLKLAKETAEVNLREKQRKSTLSPEEQLQLQKLESERKAIMAVKDPGTLGGQLATLQGNPALRSSFFANPFGEQKFKAPMEQLATGGSDTATMFAAKTPGIRFDAKLHDQSAQMQLNVSEELALAQTVAAADADSSNALLKRKDYATTTAIVNIRNKALLENRNKSIPNSISEKVGYATNYPAFASGDPAWAAKMATRELQDRQNLFLRKDDDDGITKNDILGATNLNQALLSLAATLESTMKSLTEMQQRQAKQVIEGIRAESLNATARMQAAKVNN